MFHSVVSQGLCMFKVCILCQTNRPIVCFPKTPHGEHSDICQLCTESHQGCIRCGAEKTRRAWYCSMTCNVLYHCIGTHDPNGCWTWRGAVRKTGYGVMRVGGSIRSPARVIYAATFGEVPRTMSVLQNCGTKNCCNPTHLCLVVQELRLTLMDSSPVT